ncbi:MAG: AAA family ATPase [Pseudomonadota bacterium]
MQPSMKPNTELMQKHLEHLFDGFLDGCHDGLIEIAWTDTADGKLRHAKLFGTDQIDEAVACATEQNTIQGQNIYIGAALRKKDTVNDHRAADSDILALTAYYVDIDDAAAAEKSKEQYKDCPPTCVVVTGRTPHKRLQLWWRLENPDRDPNRARSQNLALAAAFGGDRSVVNPSRVMRLAGSVAWPAKPDRVPELTELHLFNDGRLKAYPEGKIQKSFPAADEAPSPASTLNIGTLDGVSVESTIQAITSGKNWHNNALRLVAHWISRGWADVEILAAAESFTLNGYTVAQTRRDVARMTTGARAKWAIPNPTHNLDEAATTPLCPQFITDLNILMLPPRRWVLGRSLIIGYLTLLVSPPGVGKTTLVLAQAISICTGKSLTGQAVYESGKVWVHNNEDDNDELKRRLAAVLQHFGLTINDIKEKLVLSSGAERPLMIAKTDRDGNVIRQPDVAACIEFIKKNDIKVFIADPFVETHNVEENSNEQIKEVAMLYREIARQAGCAVLLVHHTSKPQQASSDGYAGNMNTARGASSLLGVARVVQTFYGMSTRDADKFGITEEERYRYVRLDDAKANLSLISANALWYERIGVTIGNGDEVGILQLVDLSSKISEAENAQAAFHKVIIAALLEKISESTITLNAAAKKLAWSDDTRFHKFRQKDAKGYERTSQSLRDAITEACRANVSVVVENALTGFLIDLSTQPATLKRYAHPINPLSQPEFTEDEHA